MHTYTTQMPPFDPSPVQVRIWDLRHPGPTLVLPAHAFEVLTAGARRAEGWGRHWY